MFASHISLYCHTTNCYIPIVFLVVISVFVCVNMLNAAHIFLYILLMDLVIGWMARASSPFLVK